MKRRVVVTGIGSVTAIGIGKEKLFDSLLQKRTSIREIPPEYEKHHKFKSRYYVPLPELKISDYGINSSSEEIMGKNSRILVVATHLALADAGMNKIDDGMLIIGVGMSNLETAFQSHLAHRFGDGKYRFNRMVIPMLMVNAPSAWCSILFGIKGPNFTVNASCASGTYAIGEAYKKIVSGNVKTALAGGVECLQDKTGSIMRGFDMLGTLTRSTDGCPRPFSKKRSGFLFNEGAGCMLVLEELEAAKKRGAGIYAEIVGYESNSDAYNIVQMESSGAQIISLLKRLVGSRKIDYLNSHGTGTVTNDEIEARVIRTVFGKKDSQPYLNSTKGILGHSIGASGAIEAAVTVLSIKESKVHGNLTDEPLNDLNLVENAFSTTINYAVSVSFGFGGHNAGLLFKKYEE